MLVTYLYIIRFNNNQHFLIPVSGTARRIISPYAIASTAASAPPFPASEASTSIQHNLPDVLITRHGGSIVSQYSTQLPQPHLAPIYAKPIPKNTNNSSFSSNQRYANRAKEPTPPDDNQTHSDHSGGSSSTYRMDDIAYADS